MLIPLYDLEGQRGDELHVLLQVATVRDAVALEELEVGGEQVGVEPDGGESAQQPLVVVVSHSTTVLDLILTLFASFPHFSFEAPGQACTGRSAKRFPAWGRGRRGGSS